MTSGGDRTQIRCQAHVPGTWVRHLAGTQLVRGDVEQTHDRQTIVAARNTPDRQLG